MYNKATVCFYVVALDELVDVRYYNVDSSGLHLCTLSTG